MRRFVDEFTDSKLSMFYKNIAGLHLCLFQIGEGQSSLFDTKVAIHLLNNTVYVVGHIKQRVRSYLKCPWSGGVEDRLVHRDSLLAKQTSKCYTARNVICASIT